MTTVSVVMNVYNNALLVGKALENIKDFADQIIIVEGAWDPKLPKRSTDGTVDIVSKFASENLGKVELYYYDSDPEISLADETHNPYSFGNQMKARNFAVKQAKCDWLMYVDSDELYHPEQLESFKLYLSAFTPGPELFSFRIPSFVFYFNCNFGIYEPFLRVHKIKGTNLEAGYTDRLTDIGTIIDLSEDELFMYHYGWIEKDRILNTKLTQWGSMFGDEWKKELSDVLEGKKEPMPGGNYHLFARSLGYGGKFEFFNKPHPETMKDIVNGQ